MSKIKQFQSMILAEFIHHCGKDITTYDWILELGAIPKFDGLCASITDAQSHISHKDGKTLCGLYINYKKEVIGEILYCSKCLLHE